MTPVPKSVDVLLATYNGARYLPEQLRSLEAQTIASWRLLVRDDGSTDETRAILAEFQARHPGAVKILDDGAGRLGPAGNYGRLLENSTADYVLLCDQDDIWLPDKIERLLGLALEAGQPGMPLLVHSDLEVIDRDGRVIAPSFWRYQYINPANCGWPRLAVQNVVTGCACLFNAALRDAALPIPAEAIMHDWWLALVAAASGEIRWTETPTIRYRQHGTNDTGAKRWGVDHWLRHAPTLFQRKIYRQKFQAYREQAGALAARKAAPISDPVRAALAEFATLDRRSYFQRVQFLRRHGIAKTGAMRNLVMLGNL
jgi:glycosyltransferase involved in cell wall biosynthesis